MGTRKETKSKILGIVMGDFKITEGPIIWIRWVIVVTRKPIKMNYIIIQITAGVSSWGNG